MELRIEKLVYGGEGLGRVEGCAVLVPLVLPGELVRAEPVKQEPRLIRARLSQVLEPAAQRIAPACPYFARCGGCHYQHAGYEDQLRYKAEILSETFRRIGKLAAPEPRVVLSPAWNYRNRMQFKFEKRGGAFRLGYFEMGTHRLLAVEQCPISSPRINQSIAELCELGKRPDFPTGKGEIEVFTDHNDSALLVQAAVDAPWPETLVSAAQEHLPGLASLAVTRLPERKTRIYGSGHLTYRDYRVSHGAFFQTNRFLVESLGAVATEGLQGETALDLFCGVGYFALHLAPKFRKVVAVETNPAAIRDLESNRTRANAAHVEPVHASAEEFLEKWERQADAVLLDPPRAGLGKSAAQRLAKIGSPEIVYVSCDPATLARDAAVLAGAGYRLDLLTLVDLFPQTFHIESIARLRKQP